MERNIKAQAAVDEVIRFLERETVFLNRVSLAHRTMKPEEIEAKELLISTTFNLGVGEATWSTNERQNIENLKWEYLMCKAELGTLKSRLQKNNTTGHGSVHQK